MPEMFYNKGTGGIGRAETFRVRNVHEGQRSTSDVRQRRKGVSNCRHARRLVASDGRDGNNN